MALTPLAESKPRSLGPARVLELDPELGARLTPEQRREAEAAVVAQMFELPPGPWTIETVTESGALGILIVEGLAGAQVGTPDRAFLELLGPEDVVQPWVDPGSDASVPTELDWGFLEPTRVLMLGRETALSIGLFPELMAALMARLVVRSRRLAFQLAAHGIVRIEERLTVLLWHFADRWGRVTTDGVVLSMKLTHQQLADVAGAQRPSVTTALGALESQGRLSRRPGHEWVLHGEPPSLYRHLREVAGLSPG